MKMYYVETQEHTVHIFEEEVERFTDKTVWHSWGKEMRKNEDGVYCETQKEAIHVAKEYAKDRIAEIKREIKYLNEYLSNFEKFLKENS